MYKIEKFSKNIYMKKIISIFLIVVFLSIFLIINVNLKISFAESKRYTYDGTNLDTNKYPGFKERLDTIKANHPNWNFIIMETGLDFEQVIKAQYGTFSNSKKFNTREVRRLDLFDLWRQSL